MAVGGDKRLGDLGDLGELEGLMELEGRDFWQLLILFGLNEFDLVTWHGCFFLGPFFPTCLINLI